MFSKIEETTGFAKAIQDFIDENAHKFGFSVDDSESSISNGYSVEIDRYSIRMGLYLSSNDLKDWKEVDVDD